MNLVNKNRSKSTLPDVEIGLDNSSEWSDEQLAKITSLIKENASRRTPERRLKNEILSVRYQMELYLDNQNISVNKVCTIESFLADYLKILNITFKKFALAIDTTDGNLKKYVSGDRKFSIDLAMKFSSFFHTSPDVWLKIQIKNELLELKQNKPRITKYKKYNYEKMLQSA